RDGGEIRLAGCVAQARVVLSFGRPRAWIGFTSQQARDLAELLIKHSDCAKCGGYLPPHKPSRPVVCFGRRAADRPCRWGLGTPALWGTGGKDAPGMGDGGIGPARPHPCGGLIVSVADVLSGAQSWHLATADVLEFLGGIPSGVVHCVITSPPYY